MALVEFIIPTYNRIEPLRCMLASLMAQNDEDWTAVVIQDSTEESGSFKVVASLGDKRIKWFATEKRYNDFGHSLREIGKQQSKAEYIIMTGDDNYYTPNFVEELRTAYNDAFRAQPGMIYWDMVHSHYNYQFFQCRPHTHQIDMGAFATRRDLAQTIRLGTRMQADGDYVEEFNIKFPREQKTKINKILFIHN